MVLFGIGGQFTSVPPLGSELPGFTGGSPIYRGRASDFHHVTQL